MKQCFLNMTRPLYWSAHVVIAHTRSYQSALYRGGERGSQALIPDCEATVDAVSEGIFKEVDPGRATIVHWMVPHLWECWKLASIRLRGN